MTAVTLGTVYIYIYIYTYTILLVMNKIENIYKQKDINFVLF